MSRHAHTPLLLGALFCCITTAQAEYTFGGHIKAGSLQQVFTPNSLLHIHYDSSLYVDTFNTRFNFDFRDGPVFAEIHYDALALHTTRTARDELLADDTRQWLDLDTTRVVDKHSTLTQRLDRALLQYSTPRIVIKAGRQALTLGNGLFFHVLDIVNPFAPATVDKDYKRGSDMLYLQFATDESSDVQIVLIPRRDEQGILQRNESSAVMIAKYHSTGHDATILGGSHYSDPIVGFGWSTTLGQAVWRTDALLTHTTSAEYVSALTNIDSSWNWFGFNIYGMVEWFHNGFGHTKVESPASDELSMRLSRGELYARGTNYLSAGLQIETHPLLLLSPSAIINIDDQSMYLPTAIIYNWRQDILVTTTVAISSGSKHSEYGGSFSPGHQASLQISYYF